VLTLYAAEENAFSRDHLCALEAVETTITLALRNSMRKELSDPLLADAESRKSLIPNLHSAIRTCCADGARLTLLLFDPGRAVEPAVAQKVQSGPGATEPRVHWGEFEAVLLPGATQARVEDRIASLKEVTGSSKWAGGIGAASYPDDGETPEALIACAERRLFGYHPRARSTPAGVA
jgi:hypothetical protein